MSMHAINFEETELRLGLPGETVLKLSNGNKRCFNETQVDLKLNISSNDIGSGHDDDDDHHHHDKVNATSNDHPPNPPAKAQVVGWPPVKSFRKNNMAATQIKSSKEDDVAAAAAATEKGSSTIPVAAINVAANFIKVSMDGAPYLRKVDLKLYKSYHQLSDALSKMFSSFTMLGNCGSQGIMKDFMNESKLIDLLNSSEYVPTYEDKDGDWMLVGDVPWDMFVDSCKRLRIMKGSEAIGLAPRALEKCKNRS